MGIGIDTDHTQTLCDTEISTHRYIQVNRPLRLLRLASPSAGICVWLLRLLASPPPIKYKGTLPDLDAGVVTDTECKTDIWT